MEQEIKILLEPEEVANQIAEEIKTIVAENVKRDRKTYMTFAGGDTPKILFNLLTGDYYRAKIVWESVHLFWSDERCVPPENEQSNFGMTKNYLLDKIDIPQANVHRIIGENDPKEEVKRIADEIKSIVPDYNGLPCFDLNFLGVGEDGHTASLFPKQKLSDINDDIVGIAFHPKTKQKRISFTYHILNNSRRNIFMVTGENKADIIFKIMKDKESSNKYPAAKIEAIEILKWYLDAAAASKIK